MAQGKMLFVICPIGAGDSPERKNSNDLEEYILRPVVEHSYDIIRADRITESGSITTQIFDHLINADVVVADMTGHNPNVFYEIAVRHAVGKPIIHMMAAGGERIPFDVADHRAIYYKLDLPGAKAASNSLRGMLDTIEEGVNEPQSPISMALQRNRLSNSTEPSEQRDSEIIAMLSDVRGQISRMEQSMQPKLELNFAQFVHDVGQFFQHLTYSLYKQSTRKLLLVSLDNFIEVTREAVVDPTGALGINSPVYPDTLGDLMRVRVALESAIEYHDEHPEAESDGALKERDRVKFS